MGTYECAKCDASLVDDILKLDDGREVQISKRLAY